MLSRLFWRMITPHQLRRGTLIVLLAWLMVAVAYQNGTIPRANEPGAQLPVSVQYPSP